MPLHDGNLDPMSLSLQWLGAAFIEWRFQQSRRKVCESWRYRNPVLWHFLSGHDVFKVSSSHFCKSVHTLPCLNQ